MLPESIQLLFHNADSFTLEFMLLLAVIWLATLSYVIVRRLVRRVKSLGANAAASPIAAER